MSLLQRIKDDQKKLRLENARRVKLTVDRANEHMIASLTTLVADAARPGMDDGKRDSTDAEVIQVVKKTIKGLEERLAVQYDDMIHTELCYLMDYLPKQLTEYEMKAIAGGYMSNNPSAKMGEVMGHFKQNYDGQYDGKTLSGIVRGII